MRTWKRALGSLALLAPFIVFASCTGKGDAASPIQGNAGALYQGARLIVGNGQVIENAAILVENGAITRVGRKGELSVPAGAATVDLDGNTIMPALINAHAHIGYERFASRTAENYTRENVISHLNRFAYYGVGAVLSAGTDPVDMALALQRDQDAGIVGGARFLFAAGMGPIGGGPGSMLPLVQATGAIRQVKDEDAAAKAVAELTAKGVQQIKIWVDDRGGTQPKLPPALYQAIIAAAHEHGARVFAHPSNGEDSKALLKAGADGLMHLRESDDEFIRLMKARDVFVTPAVWGAAPGMPPWYQDPFLQLTFSPAVASAVNQRLGESLSQIVPATAAAARDARAAAFAKVLAAGVRIILGTDAGAIRDRFYGYTEHLELQEWVRMGMTPSQAIVAATKTTAEALKLTRMGTIEAGKSADFVVLSANPLDDIANTRRIVSVYLRGKKVDRDGLQAEWRRAAN